MANKVKVIPATISRRTAQRLDEQRCRRVAAYARVSTDRDEQLTSYAAQVDYYSRYIKERDDWEFAGIYTDEGITGTNTKHREGFKKMVDDALAGKIDLIITKSVSRFARNTVDSLTTIRKLKASHVECYFEKENIWTFDGKGELLLTIMSSLAQEESRSISENCAWGQRKRFADGKVSVSYQRFLGYDKGTDGKMVINEKQAAVVRRIYGLFLGGLTPHSIAKKLSAEHIRTPSDKASRWSAVTVQSILTNEKYKGDALLQKQFVVDFLTKKRKKNKGEVPQYYVENDHEAIISNEIFEAVQHEFERRRKLAGRYSGVDLMASKIICGDCGGYYGAKVWHSTDKYRKVIHRCNKKYRKNKEVCNSPTLTEGEIKMLFVKAVNLLLEGKKQIIASLSRLLEILANTTELEKVRDQALQKMNELTEAMQAEVTENARVAENQTEYQMRYGVLLADYEQAKDTYSKSVNTIEERQSRTEMLKLFLQKVQAQNEPLDEFDEDLWGSLLHTLTAYSRENIVFLFKDGSKISVGI